ncbi:MAG: Ni/Fe-hydrogenase cytochrome b subunit [Acidimicrobiia bacterium]|nr:Ni/Fe-hydrogenase cytochrome b subunit [Acidimicrobiia bacterium]
MSHGAEPVGGPIMTRPFKILLGLGILGVLIVAWRFAVGLGPSTGLSDGYPWGLWIAFDVVTGTALACGGYAVAIVLYILNKGMYHPLIRPAILTSALGYSVAAVAIMIDVGRPWHIWRIPLGGFPDVGSYNWNSALLEVALCVMAYVAVLWIELSPAFFEKWQHSPNSTLAKFSKVGYSFMEKALIWIVALGVLLPTMHQSSLGSLMLLSGPRLHPLWNTALVPLLFLISCITMGYAAVVFESSMSSAIFKRKPEVKMLQSLYGVAVITIWIYVGLRLAELVYQGRLPEMFTADIYAAMFWLEIVLFVIPAIMYYRGGKKLDLGAMFRGAMFMVFAGALYRFDTYLVAFQPGENWTYFPTVPEILVTVGVVAIEIMVYIVIVKRFPILSGRTAAVSTS